MNHIQLEIIANEYQQEELIALLDDFSPSGFEQTEERLKAYFEEPGFAEQMVKKILEGYAFTLQLLEEQNWNSLWEQNFQPVLVDDFCGVRAHFHPPFSHVQHEIVITPKMSFGTGHHATTYMMMKHMRHIDFTNKTVFDFGTGTGILAILAEKLGAREITAIDVDEWSIENTRENAEQNQCTKLNVTLTSHLPENQFDIILANINRNVILEYMKSLVKCCKADGLILLSGLLAVDESAIVLAATENGMRLLNKRERAGWISLLFEHQ